MKSALESARDAMKGPMGGGFDLASMMGMFRNNPELSSMASNPQFLQMMMQMAQKDPSILEKFAARSKAAGAAGAGAAGANASFKEGNETCCPDDACAGGTCPIPPRSKPAAATVIEEEGDGDISMAEAESKEEVKEKAKKEAEKEKENEASTPAESDNKAEAAKEKELGNAAYKAKKFEDAIAHYNKALELYDGDVSFLTNRAAVYFEMGQFEEVVKDCDTAVNVGRDLRADYKLIARALTRKGNALMKLDRVEEAVTAFNKSLTEHRNADTLAALNKAEKALKERKESEYVDLSKCEEERDKGNQAFKEQKYPEAVQFYQEALRRGPPAVNPEAYKLYSNLAACYTKLGAYPDGVKFADKCIELNPTFAKGYSRKGTLQYFMREYEKAAETYRAGLVHEPDNDELKEGVAKCFDAISRFAMGEASAEELKERQAKSMADPDVQNILRDPVMQNVLRDFQENPREAQQHLKNPSIMGKLNKLVAAGIVQLK
nr:heat shock protein STi (STI) [Polytomella parva]